MGVVVMIIIGIRVVVAVIIIIIIIVIIIIIIIIIPLKSCPILRSPLHRIIAYCWQNNINPETWKRGFCVLI